MTTGRTSHPELSDLAAFNGDQQIYDVYNFFDALIGESVATASNLPASGNWNGRRIFVEDSKVTYVWYSGSWLRPDAGMVNGLAKRSATALSIGSAAFSDLSANTYWSTSSPQGQVAGVAAYSNGWVAPVSGLYELFWELTCDGAFYAGITVNKSSSVGVTDLVCGATAAAVQSRGHVSATAQKYLAANDALRLFGIAGATVNTIVSMGSFGLRLLKAA